MKRPAETLACVIYWLCRLALGGIFIYAASRKIGAPQELADAIASYHLIPDVIINLVALGLPLFELTCGLLLLTGYFCATGLLGIIGMLVLFLGALLSAVLRGLPVDCGCFGSLSWLGTNSVVSLVRDGVLLLGALFAYRHCIALEMAAWKNEEASVSISAPNSKLHAQLDRMNRPD